MTALPDELLDLLRTDAVCYVATTMPDGSPQLTQTWADTDGEHVVVNTVVGYQKVRNIDRDPRVSVTVSSPADPSRYWEVRGTVTASTTDGGAELAVNINASPYHRGKAAYRERMLATRAADSHSALVYVNQVGGQDELVFDGCSLAFERAAVGVNQTLASKRTRGASGVPSSRADLYS